MGLKLVAPVGVRVGVEPNAVNDAIIVGGSCLGISKPRSFKFTSLHAILNSLMFIFPSWSVSANALYSKIINVKCFQNNKEQQLYLTIFHPKQLVAVETVRRIHVLVGQ